MKKLIYITYLWLLTISLQAQNDSIVNRYLDSLRFVETHDELKPDKHFEINPYYYQMFFPSTYYSSVVKNVFSLDSANQQTEINTQLVYLYANHPSVVSHYDTQFQNETIIETADKNNKPTDDIKEEINEAIEETTQKDKQPTNLDIQLQVKRPNFWTKSGNFSLQFTQNYFSENWYQGGNNNGTMLATISLAAIYNDTKKITWENRLNVRLGFITTTSDTCHTFLTNNDQIQLNSKLGLKAAKSWSYTISGEVKTQSMPGYRSNNKLKFSDFAAPLDVAVSTGMDFRPSLKNGNSLSIAILPLSYKLRYIASNNENIHKVYNFIDRHVTQDYGSRIEINCNCKLQKNITWKCRSYCFTSYKYVEAEIENTVSFAFSKYISSDFYTLWRFDDNRDLKYYDDNLGYFQFKEYFTLGLKYNF